MSNIHKIWGERRRILLTDKTEIDLLYLKKNSFCSTHTHKYKINKFVVISGKVKIETEFGTKILNKNESHTVNPSICHRFFVIEDSIMVELAYVREGKINPNDIDRVNQGGRIVDGKEMTEDEIRKEGKLLL